MKIIALFATLLMMTLMLIQGADALKMSQKEAPTLKDYAKAAGKIAAPLAKKALDAVADQIDADGDGKISLDEVHKIVAESTSEDQ